MLRALIIIAMLICAVLYSLEIIQKQKTDTDRKARLEELSKGGSAKGGDKKALQDREDTLSNLKRLRGKLMAGTFSELPKGAKSTETHAYLYVAEPMPWNSAQIFAEEHGGSLATAASKEAMAAVSEVTGKNTAWIGGTMGVWNAAAWAGSADESSTYSGKMLICSDGKLDIQPSTEQLPFVIEWNLKSVNEGSLAFQLKRTRESITAGKPIYPSGTVSAGKSRYLLVTRSVAWEKARTMAESGSGQLVRTNTKEQAEQLHNYINGLSDKDRTLWTSANYADDAWLWSDGKVIDGDSYTLDKSGTPKTKDKVALVLKSTNNEVSYDTLVAAEKADGFVIEWTDKADIPASYVKSLTRKIVKEEVAVESQENSAESVEASGDKPAEEGSKEEVVQKDPPAALVDLKTKAKGALNNYRKIRSTEFEKIYTRFDSDVENELKKISKTKREIAKGAVANMRGKIVMDSATIVMEEDPELGERVSETIKGYVEKANKTNAQFTLALNNLHKSYLTKLSELAASDSANIEFYQKEMVAAGSDGKSLAESMPEEATTIDLGELDLGGGEEGEKKEDDGKGEAELDKLLEDL